MNTSSSHLSAICFEHIKDDYWYGAYGEFRVVMMKTNGWVNASKMCKDGGKLFKNWLANEASQRLIRALEEQLGHQASDSTLAESSLSVSYTSAGIPAEASNSGSLSVSVCKTVLFDRATEIGSLISGTYVHALLIPHVACWISEVFALKGGEIINQYLVSEYK